ncbi:MAG: hypothetical protein ISS45_01985 [Candidatus Omnitrophica bacterium]|nr:hypothetical protein [Candidatus Omnitrophota bacterium]
MSMFQKKVLLSIPLAVFLISGLSLSLSQAQPEAELPEEFELASAKVSETEGIAPVISMDFQNADLKDVLKVFSQQANLNFIAGENIKDRKVTLYLDAVSVQDALNTIMSANNLIYEQEKESKIFVVKESGKPKVETITKIFPLQYARVKGYELTAGGEKAAKSKEIGIKEILEKTITEHGKVIEDSRTNSIIVTDLPSEFAKIEQTVKSLDIKLPQVMIEAEVIETTLEAIDKLGIDWGNTTTGVLAAAYGAARTATFPFTKPQEMGKVGTADDVSGLYMGYVSANNLGGTLAMLTRDTDTKILARPKILTLNNETAEIKITAETAVSSGETEISAEGGIGTSSVSIERYETGVTLLVTPQINKIGEITMVIEPSVVNVKTSGLLDNVSDPQTRSAKTTVTIRDGETVIIGGLIHTEDERISKKVPFFGDIPLLGNFFRKQDDASSDKELIIFITPHLIEEGAKTKGLALEKQAPWEYGNLRLKEEAMERILDRFEE